VVVLLDTDGNPSTGDGGREYGVMFYDDPADPAHSWDVLRWDGRDWQSVELAPGMSFDRMGDLLTWRLHKAQLGGATRFTLVGMTMLLDAEGNTIARDRVPDSGEWIYDLAGRRVAASCRHPGDWQARGRPGARAGQTARHGDGTGDPARRARSSCRSPEAR
jgi:hypothetical protein